MKKSILTLFILGFCINQTFAQTVVSKCYSGPTQSLNNTIGTAVGSITFTPGDIPIGQVITEILVEINWSKTDDGSCTPTTGIAPNLSEVGFKLEHTTSATDAYLAYSSNTGALFGETNSFAGSTNVINNTTVFSSSANNSLLPASLPISGDTVSPINQALNTFLGTNPTGTWSILGINDATPALCIHSYCITITTCNPSSLFVSAVCKVNFEKYLDANGIATLNLSDVDGGSNFPCLVQDVSFSPGTFDCTDIGSGNIVTMTITDNLGNSASCASLFTILDTVTYVDEQIHCGSYTWTNGITYTQSTNSPWLPPSSSLRFPKDTLTNALGCDSIIILDLTILPNQTRFVQNTNDSGAGSLRQTIADACPGDIIRFAPSLIASGSDTILLTSNISFGKELVIIGLYNSSDTLFISGNNNSRIFNVNLTGSSSKYLVLDSLALINGDAGSFGFGGAISLTNGDSLVIRNSYISNNEARLGGGVYLRNFTSSPSSISITNSAIINNSSAPSVNAAAGGGVYLLNTSAAVTVRVSNSTISENSIGGNNASGGGIHAEGSSATVWLTNSTVSGNLVNGANAKAGAVYAEGGNAAVFSTNSTIHGNSILGFNASTGGVFAEGTSATISLSSSILSDNGTTNISNNGASAITSLGYNILSDASITGSVSTDQLGITPAQLNLGPLQNNGGTTPTLLPGCGSVAINLGNPSDLSDAQNGALTDARRDVGAAERLNIVNNTSSFTITECVSYTVPSGEQTITAQGTQIVLDTIPNLSCGDSIMTITVNIIGGATHTVLNANNSGAGSLRQTIADACPGDTIIFDAITNGNPIMLTSGEIFINKEIYIIGNDSSFTVLDGNNTNRIFRISNATLVEINHLTIQNGNVTGTALSKGGAIDVFNSKLFLNHALLKNNESTFEGGAISSNDSLYINNCLFIDNQINSTFFSRGGAISVSTGYLHSSNSAYINNKVVSTRPTRGGALSVSSSFLNVENSVFKGNSSSSTNDRGIAGAIQIESSSANIVNSLLSGNSISGAFTVEGGAIHIQGNLSLLDVINITNTTFAGNKIISPSSASGASIFNFRATLNLNNCILWGSQINGADNELGSFNSVAENFNSTLIKGTNTGDFLGTEDPLFLNPIPVATAPTDLGDYRLQCASPMIDAGDNSLNTTAVDLDNNARIQDGNDNGTSNIDLGAYEKTFEISTGIDVRTACSGFTWSNGITYTTDNFTAQDTLIGASSSGCDSIVTLNLTVIPNQARTVLNTNDSGAGSLRQTIADACPGDTILFDVSTNGNPILLTSGEIGFSKNLFIIGNDSSQTIIDGNNISGIFNIGSSDSVSIENLSIQNGNTTAEGGGIKAENVSELKLNSCAIKNNVAGTAGGGIFSRRLGSSCSVSLINCNVSSNSAGTNAGGVNAIGGSTTLSLVNTAVTNNTAGNSSGGIYSLSTNSSTISVMNSTISKNSATNFGGGIHSRSINLSSTINVVNSTISNNNALVDGGGIYSTSPSASLISLSNSTLFGNSADNNGGGIFSRSFNAASGSSIINVLNSTIAGNNASNLAGGIYSFSSTLSSIIDLNSSIIALNGSDNIFNNQTPTITSQGYNIFDDASINGSVATDQLGITAGQLNLGPLQNNGGTNQTLLPGCGSVAINRGNPTDFSAAQNGALTDARRDVGAAESQIITSISCPNDTTLFTDLVQCTSSGNIGSATAINGCSPIFNDAPSSLPVGNTTVTWSTTNAAGDTISCTQVVTVIDNQNPVITCPADITINTDLGLCTSTSPIGTATATDNCGVQTIVSDAPAAFPIGITTVRWIATDTSGNADTCFQVVTVIDNQNPVIACPADITINTDLGLCTSTSPIGIASATDNCGVQTIVSDAPAAFPIGTTTVRWIATDTSGNVDTCFQVVTVIDNQNPVITCPADITINTDLGLCTSTTPIGNPSATDNCGVQTIVSNAPAAFPIGTTTVRWIATDTSGNVDTCFQVVTVIDNQNPVITCPADITINTDLGLCTSTTPIGTASATDNCGVQTIVSDAPAAFPIGTTTVRWIATDTSGNADTCFQVVTVIDNQNPVITCPADITINTDLGLCTSTTPIGNPSATDNCGIQTIVSNAPAAFPIGTTTVRWIATDTSGNADTCFQVVTVIDNQNPVITCPADITINTDLGLCTSTSPIGTASATDNCGVQTIVSDAPAAFPIGTTTVRWIATDTSGNADTCFQVVTVVDNEAPILTCTPNQIVAGDANCSIVLEDYTDVASVTDNCTANLLITQTPAPGTSLSETGTNIIELSTQDDAGNITTCLFEVEIIDTIAPLLECLANQIETLDASCNFVLPDYSGVMTYSDNCIDNLSITQSPLPGTIYRGVQEFPVNITFEDVFGNVSACNFIVNVQTDQLNLGCLEDIFITTLMTPNGDGKNDTWRIDEIDYIKFCDVMVFNRWGIKVHEQVGYEEAWDGTASGMDLPDGDYYYVIECDGVVNYTGPITILRSN